MPKIDASRGRSAHLEMTPTPDAAKPTNGDDAPREAASSYHPVSPKPSRSSTPTPSLRRPRSVSRPRSQGALTPLRVPSPGHESQAQHSAAQLLDSVLLEGCLNEVLSQPILQHYRAAVTHWMSELPDTVARSLCQQTLLWVGPKASPFARMATLLGAVEVREALAEGAFAEAPPGRLDRWLQASWAQLHKTQERAAAEGSVNPYLAALAVHEGPAQNLSALWAVPWLVGRIDPPAGQRESWIAEGREAWSDFLEDGHAAHYPALLPEVAKLVTPQSSPWVVASTALGLLDLCLTGAWEGRAPLPAKDGTVALYRALRAQHPEALAVALARDLAPLNEALQAPTLRCAHTLVGLLPRYSLDALVHEIAGFSESQLARAAQVVAAVMPRWVTEEEGARMLSTVMLRLSQIDAPTIAAYQTLCRPDFDAEARLALLQALLAWRGPANPGTGTLPQALAWLTAHAVPAQHAAAVLEAWQMDPKTYPQLRAHVQQVLEAKLAPGTTQALLERLAQAPTRSAVRLIERAREAEASHAARKEDLESAMHEGRLRASDRMVAQVMDAMPEPALWRQTLAQVASYLQAAELDPRVEPLLRSTERTGVSEFANARYTLSGPTGPNDATASLLKDPPYALSQHGRVVGLGQLAAALWQLLRDQPAPAPTETKQLQQRGHARTNFLLALARSVETHGHRVCGWGLSERLTEACSGYIAGIAPEPLVYPQALLTETARAFADAQPNPDRHAQEAFYFHAVHKAEATLYSPEAAAHFTRMLGDYMQLTYDWPAA